MDSHRDRSQREQARLEARVEPVVFLYVVLEAAEQKRRHNKNSVLAIIAPATDAFTSMYCPLCSAAGAMAMNPLVKITPS